MPYVLYFGDFSMRDDGFLQNGAQGQWRSHTAVCIILCEREIIYFLLGTFYRTLTFAQWSQYPGYLWNIGKV